MAQCLWVMTAAKKKTTTSCMTFHCSEAVAFFEADVWHELIPLSPLGCEHVPATCPTDRTSQLDTRRYGNHYFWWVHICMLCVPRAAKCYVIDFKYPAQIFFVISLAMYLCEILSGWKNFQRRLNITTLSPGVPVITTHCMASHTCGIMPACWGCRGSNL